MYFFLFQISTNQEILRLESAKVTYWSEAKWTDVPLLDQRLVLTKADLERCKTPRNEEARVIQPI